MNWLVKRLLFILVMCIGGITLANWLYGPVPNWFAFVYGMLVGIAGAILFPQEEKADE